MCKVLLISGSNRRGNTEKLLKNIYIHSMNSELILLKEKNIEFCKGCLACHNMPKCVIKDDMKEIVEKMLSSELIIFGVPNYFDNVTGLFKNFIDRLHPLYKSHLLEHKKVIFLYVGGGKEEGTLASLHESVKGMVKYLGLNVVKEEAFKALNPDDELDQTKIREILKEIDTITH